MTEIRFCPTCSQPVHRPRICTCDHTEGGHDIKGNGSRGACSFFGPLGRCGCKVFEHNGVDEVTALIRGPQAAATGERA